MATQVMLELPERVFERAEHLAQLSDQDLAQAIIAYLDANLPPMNRNLAEDGMKRQRQLVLAREKAAYLRLHPYLKEKFLGKHVAIYHEELLDHDEDLGTLYERVRAHYPQEMIWIALVREDPIEIMRMRSPRFSLAAE